MTEMNRRTLLKGSVAMGAAALFGSEAAHAAGAVALPKKWDETTEVLVIGSGFAGRPPLKRRRRAPRSRFSKR